MIQFYVVSHFCSHIIQNGQTGRWIDRLFSNGNGSNRNTVRRGKVQGTVLKSVSQICAFCMQQYTQSKSRCSESKKSMVMPFGMFRGGLEARRWPFIFLVPPTESGGKRDVQMVLF